jgi:hypothetical protein
MRAGLFALGLAAAACGRFGFAAYNGDAHGGGGGGGGGGDGGSSVDAPIDAPPPSLCATSSFVMCDGFETDMISDPPWSSNFGVTIDAEHVYRGLFAAHAHTPALTATENAQTILIDNGNRTTFGAGTTYLRAFLYLTSASAQSFGIGEVDPLSNASGQIAAYFVSSGELVIVTDSTTNTPTGVTMPTDQWVCFEVSVRGSTTTSSADAEIIVWLDGAQIADVTSFNLSPSQQFNFGPSLFGEGAQPATDLWMDEVALDTSRIGCTD